MIKRVEAALTNEDAASLNLPERLEFLGDPEKAMRYWDWLEAIDWKWDLNTVQEQDEVLMHDVAEIASVYNIIYRMARKERDGK